MSTVWAHRNIDASADVLWRLLTDLDAWPAWGPTVRRAALRGDRFEQGAVGTVTTVFDVDLAFEISNYDPGSRWAWKVAGVPATDHTVEALGTQRCRVGFGVPWPASPYLAVCHVALRRLDRLAIVEERR